MTKEMIDSINRSSFTMEQGVYVQPSCIPTNVKGLVAYSRYDESGYEGGSCWDNDDNGGGSEYYENDEPWDFYKIFHIVIGELRPNITVEELKECWKLIQNGYHHENEYYGNCSNYRIAYMEISKLEALIKSFDDGDKGKETERGFGLFRRRRSVDN